MTKPRFAPGPAAERAATRRPLMLLAAAIAVAPPAAALSTDREQPIEVQAATAELDERKNVSIYSGGVVVTQGSIRITGDRMTARHTEEKKLERLIMEGRRVTYRQLPDDSDRYDQAVAKRMEYHQPRNLILLLDEACVKQGESIVTGQRIEYNTRLSRVNISTEAGAASGPALTAAGPATTDNRRVKLVLRKDEKEAAAGTTAATIPADLREDCKIVPEEEAVPDPDPGPPAASSAKAKTASPAAAAPANRREPPP